MSIADKLQYTLNSVDAVREALLSRGADISDKTPLSEFSDKILRITGDCVDHPIVYIRDSNESVPVTDEAVLEFYPKAGTDSTVNVVDDVSVFLKTDIPNGSETENVDFVSAAEVVVSARRSLNTALSDKDLTTGIELFSFKSETELIQEKLCGYKTMAEIAASKEAMYIIITSESIMEAIMGDQNAVAKIPASTTAMNILSNNIMCMNLLSSSAVARSVIGLSGTAFNIINGNEMAVSKYISVYLGISPYHYADMQHITESTSIMDSFASNSNLRNMLIASLKGAAYKAVAGSIVAITKCVAACIDVSPGTIGNSIAASNFVSNTTNTTALVNSSDGMALVSASRIMLKYIMSYDTAMTAIEGSTVAKNAMLNSPIREKIDIGVGGYMGAGTINKVIIPNPTFITDIQLYSSSVNRAGQFRYSALSTNAVVSFTGLGTNAPTSSVVAVNKFVRVNPGYAAGVNAYGADNTAFYYTNTSNSDAAMFYIWYIGIY